MNGNICPAVLFLSGLWLHVHIGHCSVVLPSYPQGSSIYVCVFSLSFCLSACIRLYLSVYLCLSLLKSMLSEAWDPSASLTEGWATVNPVGLFIDLSLSWMHGSNYKGPGHVEILWGHLKSISLDTLHSSLSTYHLPKFFLRKGTQAPTALRSPKPIGFQSFFYCEHSRESHKSFFHKNTHCVVTFCLPLLFPLLPSLSTLCHVCTCGRMP